MSVMPCPKCGRVTPIRHSQCVYCASSLRNPNPQPSPKKKTEDKFEEPRMLGVEKARFQRQSDDKNHVLITPTGEPIELQQGKLFVLGRDPRASLVVQLSDVSRQHAEVDWKGEDPPRPVLNEIRSRNGTFLNNQRVTAGEPQPLRSGDEIRLGNGFRARYFYLTPRDLRLSLQELGEDDTRSFKVGGEAGAAPAAAVAATEPGTGSANVEDIVAAALGEAELTSLDTEGDFVRYRGRHLVKRLYAQRKSGVLTVYDGVEVGEMVLIEGRCRHASMGMRSGREALEHVACLDRGRYRFRPDDPDYLASAPPPTEVDESGLALSGDFVTTPASDLVRDLVQRKATGVVTVFDERQSGQLMLENGLCQEVRLGTLKEREALDAIVRMGTGVYRFRPGELRHTPSRAPAPPIPAPGAYRSGQTDRRTLRLPDDEAGVQTRSSQPMRAPRTVRRRPPPPPRRRQPPPPHY